MLIDDLTRQPQLLKKKQFNGYYGCKHKHHLSNQNDPELETRGIRGASTLLAMIENLPLKGVACDLLKFLCEILSCVPEVDPWIKDVSLPSELTRALRPLNRLCVFKVSELKTFLLYFSPIVFAPFMTEHHGNLRDLSYIVYALRSLYESDHHADLCGVLLDSACRNLSNKYTMRGFDSINFHLLRHLSWQFSTFGRLRTTSATQFESANHLLVRTLTGTVNTCRLLVQRYFRNKLLHQTPVERDHLQGFTSELFSKPFQGNDAYSMEDTPLLIQLKKDFHSARFFCCSQGDLHLNNTIYSRSQANSFVELQDGKVGEIHCFF